MLNSVGKSTSRVMRIHHKSHSPYFATGCPIWKMAVCRTSHAQEVLQFLFVLQLEPGQIDFGHQSTEPQSPPNPHVPLYGQTALHTLPQGRRSSSRVCPGCPAGVDPWTRCTSDNIKAELAARNPARGNTRILGISAGASEVLWPWR